VLLCVLGVVSCLPQTGTNLCGTDERGTVRQAGDTWQQDCNRCRCTDNLLPGCTKRFCGGFSQSSSTPAPRLGGGGGGVMFPGVSRSETEPAPVPHCTDQSGQRREVGEAWKEDCNNCRCGNTAVPLCTQRFCIDVEQFRKDRYLFTVDTSRSTEGIVQCRSDGARNCQAVILHPSQLSPSAQSGSQFLKLLPGSEVELEVVRGPADQSSPTLSYQFSLTDGGDGSLTYRPATSASQGAFRPTTGSVHYTVEACGDGCNVIYERDSDYFSQFED